MNPNIPLVQNVINEIEKNLREPISVGKMSQGHGVSPWQFQRIFRSVVGDSLGNYIRHRKLTLGANLLRNGQMRIIDIAFELGFNSQEAFTRSIKSYFALTPKQIREKKKSILIQKKPQITQEMLNHFNGGVNIQPKIVDFPHTLLVGEEVTINFDLANYLDYDSLLVPFWEKFMPKKQEISNLVDGKTFGLARSSSRTSEDDQLLYLAAYEVSSFKDIPAGMVTYEIPPQRYAIFTNKGSGNKTSYTINYIYGTWLPQHPYSRSEGDDFEVFDERYTINSDNSESDYYLPVH